MRGPCPGWKRLSQDVRVTFFNALSGITWQFLSPLATMLRCSFYRIHPLLFAFLDDTHYHPVCVMFSSGAHCLFLDRLSPPLKADCIFRVSLKLGLTYLQAHSSKKEGNWSSNPCLDKRI